MLGFSLCLLQYTFIHTEYNFADEGHSYQNYVHRLAIHNQFPHMQRRSLSLNLLPTQYDFDENHSLRRLFWMNGGKL